MTSNLLQDLIAEILIRLPVKSVVRFLCVSKEWYSLITSSYFIKMHLKFSIETNRDRTLILNEEDFAPASHYISAVQFSSKYNRFGKTVEIYQPLLNWVVSDYCDGLVCLHNGHEKQDVAVWNPLVRKYRRFPFEPIEEPSGFSDVRFSHLAFGHDPRNDDYKVLRVIEFYMEDMIGMEFEVKVCSMRSPSWKKIDERWPNMVICCWKSVALNGDVYWLVADRVGQHRKSLLAFDLATEKFRLYGTPVPLENYLSTFLDVLGGLLCCIVHDYMYCDVYLMKKYGVEGSWTQIFKIEKNVLCRNFEYFRTLMFSTNGKKVLLEEHPECGRTNLIWYDIEKNRCYRVKNRSFPYVFKVATCIGSLLLLDGDNVIDPPQKKNKRKRKR
ncbi:f-box protein cpr1 [Quercus suber]|uniref:F-box protein cpr1 n=1 Tax=Quercus suber TaxID=58331 RepID=A0AAW0K8C8_QUESU